ncbi:uncharacterized protein LOC116617264 isoform X2 [Nematostella vectensis]|nr:uncharacterized protein LOC116617264 isoform X2 [Nematostella vectensis]XP_032235718.1 uncharacterized protein LOC116617264 isoform X2 [Nematostella vectensis]
MGNDSSKKANSQAQSQNQTSSHERSIDGVRRILLVHNSSTNEELQSVKNFRDALVQAAPGSIKIDKLVNIAEKSENFQGVTWLEKLNNVILIRLSTEHVQKIADTLRKNNLVDENDHLHGKVMGISFGKELPAGWPPSGSNRREQDQRDFVFGLEDENNAKAKDFTGAKLNSLVAAIMATN